MVNYGPCSFLSMFEPRPLEDGFSSPAKIISDFSFQEFSPLTIVHRYLEGAMWVNIVASFRRLEAPEPRYTH